MGRVFEYEKPLEYFYTFRVELFLQWLDIYYVPSEKLSGLIDEFPYKLFGYESFGEFLGKQIPQLIAFYCFKAKRIDQNQLDEISNMWIECEKAVSTDLQQSSDIMGMF